MLVLVTYDVNTETSEGRRRLRMVAKKCTSYGIRIQNSVFECNIDNAKYHQLTAELSSIIDQNSDSLRFYVLGNKYQDKVTHIGTHETYDLESPLLL